MEYKEYAKQDGCYLSTGIHTKVNKEIRISSAYRKYSNPHFESYGWETIVWKNDKVEYIYDPRFSADEVVNLHAEIMNEFK